MGFITKPFSFESRVFLSAVCPPTYLQTRAINLGSLLNDCKNDINTMGVGVLCSDCLRHCSPEARE